MMEVVSPTLGLKMQISSATKDGTGQIESIAISDASPLTTDRGIGIGSTRERVEAEYNDYYNPDDSSTQVPAEFVAGSV